MNAPAKKRLGELLVEAGVIDETQLKAALGHQRQWGIRLGQSLVDLKLATEQDVVRVLAKKYGFEVARLDQVEAYAHQQAIGLVPRDFALKYNVFPLGADTSTLAVAMSDPTNLAVVDELRFRSGRRVKVSIGGDHEVAAAIEAAYPQPGAGVEAIALDIDEGGVAGEPVLDSFGGGSSQDFDSFFGAGAAPAPDAAAADDPFSAEPVAALPLAGPASAAVKPLPAAPGPAAPHPPAPAPASPGPRAPLAAGPAPASTPAPPRPAATGTSPPPAGNGSAGPSRPAQPSAAPPRPTSPRPADSPAPGRAPTVPAVRPVPAPGPAPTAARPAARPAAGPVQAAATHLELPSPDALREARARRAPTPPPSAEPEPLVDLEAELIAEAEAVPPAASGAGALTEGEKRVLDAVERLAEGGHAQPELLKPTQAIAVLIRILLRKGLITERELLDALGKSGGE
ncbi:MAG TPA: hypothetical protein VFG59_11860 [Anaeromyxobacter sp.]|nr:hypothetical protein [Anaeromyxobacter sp.]